MKILKSSAYLDKLNNNSSHLEPSEPDELIDESSEIPDSFVISRNPDGSTLSTYGDESWNLNPYRLGIKSIPSMIFTKPFNEVGEIEETIIRQCKTILFSAIYYYKAGRLGRLSATTITYHFAVLYHAMKYCSNQKDKLSGVITLKELFANHIYVADFIRNSNKTVSHQLPQVLTLLMSLGKNRTGITLFDLNKIKFAKRVTSQHPVIPTRLYLKLINLIDDELERLKDHQKLEFYIAGFKNKYYGRTESYLSKQVSKVKRKKITLFEDALKEHDLSSFFVVKPTNRKDASLGITTIQCIVKCAIHLYTGMRHDEVMRLRYDCLSNVELIPPIKDALGNIKSKARTVQLISSTTKFTGYKRLESWIAPELIINAVNVLQSICRGLFVDTGENKLSSMPLFSSPRYMRYNPGMATVLDLTENMPHIYNELIVTQADIDELQLTHNDFDSISGEIGKSGKFIFIGKQWPLNTHQARRSLAYYGSNSGHISLSSLSSQYKHKGLEMTDYYRRNFAKLKTIFGSYNPESTEYELSPNHFLYEYQTAISSEVAYNILAAMLDSETTQFGGTGSYMEKQKGRIANGEVSIAELRSDTEAQAQRGELAYVETALGGCTKLGRCDKPYLGDITGCVGCASAMLNEVKINVAVEALDVELRSYDENSFEYKITKADQQKLINALPKDMGGADA
jgi:hypothetical protein